MQSKDKVEVLEDMDRLLIKSSLVGVILVVLASLSYLVYYITIYEGEVAPVVNSMKPLSILFGCLVVGFGCVHLMTKRIANKGYSEDVPKGVQQQAVEDEQETQTPLEKVQSSRVRKVYRAPETQVDATHKAKSVRELNSQRKQAKESTEVEEPTDHYWESRRIRANRQVVPHVEEEKVVENLQTSLENRPTNGVHNWRQARRTGRY